MYNESVADLARQIRARATGLRAVARAACATDDGSQFDRLALLVRADEAEAIAALVEDAIENDEKDGAR